MAKTGLVLEGGGMRGLYTAGVLDCFLDHGIHFDYIIGVSAGVCHGISFLSGQRGRTRRINIDYGGDRRYVGFHNLIRTGSMFGMDFIFDEIPKKLELFDYDTFRGAPSEFVIGVTEVKTGRPVYFYKRDYCEDGCFDRLNLMARASSAIPVFSPMVEIDGSLYLDGGTADSIPLEQALKDGCDRVAVVLTRHKGFVRRSEKFRALYARMYHNYPEMVRCLDTRHERYNASLSEAARLERENRAFVLCPRDPVRIGRFERNREKLQELYQEGYDETAARCGQLAEFLRP